MLDAAIVVTSWTAAGPPHRRLDRLLRAARPSEPLDADTLGMRNQRLLGLIAAVPGALDAVAPCPGCGAQNEFALPAAEVLALPPPARDEVEAGDARFRLPRMADLLADDPTPLTERCRVDGEGAVPPALAAEAGARLEALDPAADIGVDLACPDCALAYRASVDVAGFVAAAVDRAADRLYGEIDLLASAYGWTEDAILSLPPERRRRYVALVQERAGRRLPGPRP